MASGTQINKRAAAHIVVFHSEALRFTPCVVLLNPLDQFAHGESRFPEADSVIC
jgi:hypothetical protein